MITQPNPPNPNNPQSHTDPHDYVIKTAEERNVGFIQLWFTDVLGISKSFSITPAELETALGEGMTFDGSAIDGFSRVQESDVLAMPDIKTFQILPWKVDGLTVARVVCDIYNLDGSPFAGCPRQVLRKTLEKASHQGLTFFASPEIEYFYFVDSNPSSPPQPLDNGSYFELTVKDLAGSLLKRTVLALEEMGIPVEYAQHEDAPGQYEIDLRHTDALSMADAIMTTRLVIKEVALQQGVHASFMPKPLRNIQGSGMHTHFSLFNADTDVFYDSSDERGLSPLGAHFMAGILQHAREITAITNQWINSYKRLSPGWEAPTYVSWARNNRSALIRVPLPKGGNPQSTRLEYRAPDPACNPYLVFALVLAAGLKGIENSYELPPESSGNLFVMSQKELEAQKITALPISLEEALTEMSRSELVKETFSKHVFEWFLRNKQAEIADYNAQVTQYELDHYFQRL